MPRTSLRPRLRWWLLVVGFPVLVLAVLLTYSRTVVLPLVVAVVVLLWLFVGGPLGSFASYPDISKLTMAGLMWLGRLEIIPVVVVLTRHYWRVR
mgnify:CR=1 FL=1